MPEGDLLSILRKPVVVVSAALDVEYANAAFTDLVARGEALDACRLGQAIRSTPALSAALTGAVGKLRAPGWSCDARWAAGGADGRVFDLRVVRMDGDRFAAVLDDVTHHLRVQEIQGRARGYLEAVLNHLPLGVIVLDADFGVTFFNRAQAELFGRLGLERPLFEVIGAPVAETYPVLDADQWQGVYARVVGSGEAAAWNRVGYPRDQPSRYFMVNLVPLGGQEGPSLGAICITDDVTRTVGLERELLEKERLALLGQMALALNHEINNPLAAILGSAEALLFTGGLSGEQVGRLETIREHSLRIVDVTRRLHEVEEVHLTEYIQGGPLMVDLTSGSASRPSPRSS